MRLKAISTTQLAWWCFLMALTGAGQKACAGDMKFEAHLVWGTNDKQPPDFKYKPVSPEIQKTLEELPLKWSQYFEVSEKSFDMKAGDTKRVPLSEKCEIEVKDLGKSKIEVTHYGKGQEVLKRTQDLPRGKSLVLGGNAPNATAWLIVLKRVK